MTLGQEGFSDSTNTFSYVILLKLYNQNCSHLKLCLTTATQLHVGGNYAYLFNIRLTFEDIDV